MTSPGGGGIPLAEAFIRLRPEADRSEFKNATDRALGGADLQKVGEKHGRSLAAGMGTGLKRLAGIAGGVLIGGAIAKELGKVKTAAADLGETVSKTRNVFGKSATSVLAWSKTSASAFGLSQNAALTAAGQFGDMFKQLGYTEKASARTSTQLVKVAGDLASFHNRDPSDVLERISAGFRGEYDSLQLLIPNINAARVEQEALRLGLVKSTVDSGKVAIARQRVAIAERTLTAAVKENGKGSAEAQRARVGLATSEQALKKALQGTKVELSGAARAQAVLSIIQKDGAAANNDFAETSAGVANQQRIAKAQTENLRAAIGTALTPALAHAYRVMNTQFLPPMIAFANTHGPAFGRQLGALAEEYGPKVVTFFTTAAAGVKGLMGAYQSGYVTSDGFVGVMQRVGVGLQDIVIRARALGYSLQDVDWASFRSQVDSIDFGALIQQLRAIDFRAMGEQLKSVDATPVVDGLKVFGALLGFVADHIDVLVAALPYLLAGFVAYKAAQAAANVAALAAIPIQAAQTASNIILARSIKSLAASNVQSAGATGANTGAQAVQTAITNANAAATARGRIATLLGAAAQRVATVAAIVGTAAMRALGAAWLFATGPIGIAIGIIALVVAGLVLAYKKSETFRNIVNTAFAAVGNAAKAVWEGFLKPVFGFYVGAYTKAWEAAKTLARFVGESWGAIKGFFAAGVRAVVDYFLGMVQNVLDGAVKMFGWVPKLGDKLRTARDDFVKFRNGVNTALGGVKDRDVKVSVVLGAGKAVVGSGMNAVRIQKDGGIVQFAEGSENHIAQIARAGDMRLWAEPETGGEAYVPLAPSKRQRSTAILGNVAQRFGYNLVPAANGLVISPQLVGKRQFDTAISNYNAGVDRFAMRVGREVAKQANGPFSASMAGVVNFAKAQAGKPYVWGAAGPFGFDCSGFVSALVNVARGLRNPYQRRFATGSLPAGDFSGAGNRAFRIGWMTAGQSRSGVGHVGATVNGVPMESRGGDGVVVGRSTRGADQSIFRQHAFLKMARGGLLLPGDPPFHLLDKAGGNRYRPGLLEALVGAAGGGMKVFDSGGYLDPGDVGINLRGGRERVLDAKATRAYDQGGASVEDFMEALSRMQFTIEGDQGRFVARRFTGAGARGRGR